MNLSISPFDPADAPDQDLADYYDLVVAEARAERPEDPEPTYENAVGRLRTPFTALGRCLYWAGHDGDRLVGLIGVGLPGQENAGQAIIDVKVHVDSRRQGIGTALLRAALPAVSAQNRELVAGWGLMEGGSGARWADHLGFRTVYRQVFQDLDLTAVDRGLWDVPVAPEYRLEQWAGTAPEGLLATYAHARGAIHDVPPSDWSYRPPAWTPERVRQAETDLRGRGVEQLVVAAVHEASGAAVGLTELELYPHRKEFGYQQETAVLASHRGRGLGRSLKAQMARRLVAEHPQLTHVWTTTAADNVHMIRVNHQIGYTTVRTTTNVELETTTLRQRLAE